MTKSVGSALALAAATGYFALVPPSLEDQGAGGGTTEARPVWTEVKCPFPIDQWSRVRLQAADCGSEVKLYLRAKLGSCNCTTGIVDDADLDRMSDFDLGGGSVSPLVRAPTKRQSVNARVMHSRRPIMVTSSAM